MQGINKEIGAWLLRPGNTREKLADAVGITTPTLSTRLNGSTQWRFSEVVKLSKFIDVTLEQLADL